MSESSKDLTELPATENSNGDCFPVGLRVLVLEDSILCLRYLVKILEKCRYKVTTATEASEALQLLRQKEEQFDIVITNVERCDIDGFKLLEIITLEMDIPVVLMSASDDKEKILRGVRSGACDYLVKPVRMQEMKNIWQHVMRKNLRASDKLSITNYIANQNPVLPQKDKDKKVKFEDEDQSKAPPQFEGESSSRKKTRVLWDQELHFKFLSALQQLGEKDAVPNKILSVMNQPGLTRENIASHLQKHRNNLKKQNTISGEQNNLAGIHNLGSNSSINHLMDLMPQTPIPADQASFRQSLQYPNFVGQTPFSPMAVPLSSKRNNIFIPDGRLSTFTPYNTGVSFQANELTELPSSYSVGDGTQFPGYLGSIQHYNSLRGDGQNSSYSFPANSETQISSHPLTANSATETGLLYQHQNPFTWPSMNLPTTRNQDSSLYYSGIGDSNNRGIYTNFADNQQGQNETQNFQQSPVNTFMNDDLSAIVHGLNQPGAPNLLSYNVKTSNS